MRTDAERYKFLQVLIVDDLRNLHTWQLLGHTYAREDDNKEELEVYMNKALDVIYSRYQGRIQ